MADKVYAFRINGKLQVAPSPVIVEDNKKLDLVNLTGDDLDWTFPKQVFGKGKNSYKTGKPNGGKPDKETTDRTADRSAPGVFGYHVEKARPLLPRVKGKKRQKRAELNDDDFADPVIIIEG